MNHFNLNDFPKLWSIELPMPFLEFISSILLNLGGKNLGNHDRSHRSAGLVK